MPPTAGQPLLQLFLGPEPPPFRAERSGPHPWQSLPTLQLQARPLALAEAALLPLQLPMPLQQADQLEVLAQSDPADRDGPTRLQGRLAITPRRSVPQSPPPPRPQPSSQLQPPLLVAP